ncbi:hypothetical protein PG984_007156 [Apiospora sp. TS-2023a]
MSSGSKPLYLWAIVILALTLPVPAWPLFPLLSRASDTDSGPFANHNNNVLDLRYQILNPQGILAVLLLVGADVVQKSIAQSIGGNVPSVRSRLNPVVFSFGWVSYAVNSVAAAIGDGIFLPEPDHSGFVITLDSGDRRPNQSWLLGRLIRDLEIMVDTEEKDKNRLKSGLLVTIFQTMPDDDNQRHGMLNPTRQWLWLVWCPVVLLQGAVAAIPLYSPSGTKSWYVFAITAIGTGLALATASITSMHRAKFPPRKNSTMTYAITRGNGHKHVFVILPNSREKSESSLPHLEDIATNRTKADGLTRLFSIPVAITWIFLLLSVAGLQGDTGFLLIVGLIGMCHNVWVASRSCSPDEHGIPLKRLEIDGIRADELGRKIDGLKPPRVNDVLKVLEKEIPGAGYALFPLMFPGPRAKNKEMWKLDEDIEKGIIERRKHRMDLLFPESRISEEKTTNQSNTAQTLATFLNSQATSGIQTLCGTKESGERPAGASTVPQPEQQKPTTNEDVQHTTEVLHVPRYRLNTSGENGQCGFYAIIESMKAQYPACKIPTIDELNLVLDLERADHKDQNSEADESNKRQEILKIADPSHNNRNWFLNDDLAVLFNLWARRLHINMILGIWHWTEVKGRRERRYSSDTTTESTPVLWIAFGKEHYEGLSYHQQPSVVQDNSDSTDQSVKTAPTGTKDTT